MHICSPAAALSTCGISDACKHLRLQPRQKLTLLTTPECTLVRRWRWAGWQVWCTGRPAARRGRTTAARKGRCGTSWQQQRQLHCQPRRAGHASSRLAVLLVPAEALAQANAAMAAVQPELAHSSNRRHCHRSSNSSSSSRSSSGSGVCSRRRSSCRKLQSSCCGGLPTRLQAWRPWSESRCRAC